MFLPLFLFFSTLIFATPTQAQIHPSVEQFLRQKGISPQTTAIYAVWADTEEPVAAYQETLPLSPASSLKVLTTYCSLKKLGLDHTFETNFLSEGPIQKGEIQNLWVQGKGDPTLVSEKLWLIVQSLKSLGLRKINGNIYIDSSYFDEQDYPGRQENNERAYNAPPSALSLNFNSVAMTLFPDGGEIKLSLFPQSPYFQIHNSLKRGGKNKVFINTQTDSSYEILTLSGTVPYLKEPLTLYRSIQKPDLFFGNTLKAQLTESGIQVMGEPKKGVAEGKSLLFQFHSKPLREIVQDMNKFSNNFIAEQLVKYLGAQFFERPGSTAKGVKVLNQCLVETGLKPDPFFIENGSGLSYKNKISSKALVRVLTASFHDFSIAPEFISSLSVAGLDGTMKKRHSPKGLEGILRAKTGHLNGTSSLAGFVPAQDGKIIAFAILMNHFKGGPWKAHRLQDELVLKWSMLQRR